MQILRKQFHLSTWSTSAALTRQEWSALGTTHIKSLLELKYFFCSEAFLWCATAGAKLFQPFTFMAWAWSQFGNRPVVHFIIHSFFCFHIHTHSIVHSFLHSVFHLNFICFPCEHNAIVPISIIFTQTIELFVPLLENIEWMIGTFAIFHQSGAFSLSSSVNLVILGEWVN